MQDIKYWKGEQLKGTHHDKMRSSCTTLPNWQTNIKCHEQDMTKYIMHLIRQDSELNVHTMILGNLYKKFFIQ